MPEYVASKSLEFTILKEKRKWTVQINTLLDEVQLKGAVYYVRSNFLTNQDADVTSGWHCLEWSCLALWVRSPGHWRGTIEVRASQRRSADWVWGRHLSASDKKGYWVQKTCFRLAEIGLSYNRPESKQITGFALWNQKLYRRLQRRKDCKSEEEKKKGYHILCLYSLESRSPVFLLKCKHFCF